jgi:hypothetical protein
MFGFLKRRRAEKHGISSEEYIDVLSDSETLTDPGPRGGPLGAINELPEGGDSTRFTPEQRRQMSEAYLARLARSRNR